MSGRNEVDAFTAIAELCLARGEAPMNKYEGCYVFSVPSSSTGSVWTIAVNAHPEPHGAHPEGCMEIDIEPFHVAVWWNGWLAGLLSPYGGVLAAHPDGANEERLVADLRAAMPGGNA